MGRTITAAALAILIPSTVPAQSAPRVYVSVSAGIADLRGGGLVSSTTEPAIAGRVTIQPFSRVGFDLEASVTGATTGTIFNRRADWQWRETRREAILAAGVRVTAWRTRFLSIEPVAGLAWIKPAVQAETRRYNPLINAYGEWLTSDPGEFGHGGFYGPYDRWTAGFGADIAIGTRRIAVVPEIRVYAPLWGSSSPSSEYGVHTRGAIGVRLGF